MKKILIPAAVAFAADLLSKKAAEILLTKGEFPLGKVAVFSLQHNTGMAFGLFSGKPFLSLILPLMVVLLAFLLLKDAEWNCPGKIGMGLLLGGFAGNYAERVLTGKVTDFLFLPWLPWFVCNVADIAVCAGVILLIWDVFITSKKEKIHG